jgi:hypothetical protein
MKPYSLARSLARAIVVPLVALTAPVPEARNRSCLEQTRRPLGRIGSGIGGKGVCTGADSLEVKGLRSVSISENGSTQTIYDGYVHFVELQ